MLLKNKKNLIKKLIFGVYIFSAFLLSIGFVIASQKVTGIAESKITFLGNQREDKPKPIIPEVAGVEKIPEIKLIDLPSILPELTSKAVLAIDYETEQILYKKNITSRLSPASTTKIMTALVAIEYFKPADILTVTEGALVGGSTMGLRVGENLTFRSLLYGMMLNSGNDAAYTIAINYPGGFNVFLDEMNKKAKLLGLRNTHFQNPAGFDNEAHYSSAEDLLTIAKLAMKNNQFAKVVSTKETSVISWDKSNAHELKNLNKLLSIEGVLGVKTGFTEKSGENFVGLVERNGHKVMTVVLDSEDRFGESKKLMDWIFQNYVWQ